ncbi:MAG TPA: cardiolipin synthase [Bacilli bacterium]|nr:cardiolipin synthase [Bacilli bacterium]
MLTFFKKLLRVLLSRAFIVSLLLFVQLFLLVFLIISIGFQQGLSYYVIFSIVGILVAFTIINRDFNPAYKISWIIAILTVPFVGVIFYLMFGRIKMSKKTRARIDKLEADNCKFNQENPGISNFDDAEHQKIYNYLTNTTAMPAWENTETTILSPGEKFLPSLLEELKKAKKFIFLEFFIIAKGKMWSAIHEILKQKISEGVEVRIIYDDFGCLKYLPRGFKKQLIAEGIKVATFNPLIPVLSISINYRDHRKIAIVDGKVGWTGGMNIGDEYVNKKEVFGYWKDAMIKIEGEAVLSLTSLFINMWELCTKEKLNYQDYKSNHKVPSQGIVQVFGDTPFDGHLVTETVYMKLIAYAKRYVYITTPYLIIDNEVSTALKTAALSGVDVRIVVPHIPDKRLVFWITQSYYMELISAGVKIYEYTPGFIHAKTIITDDSLSVIGSANLDFRSLYLHFESSCLLYNTKSLVDIKADIDTEIAESELITLEKCKEIKLLKRIFVGILRIFAPML